MKKMTSTISLVLISILFSQTIRAENSVSFELLFPPALTFETGIVNDGNKYLSAKIQITGDNIYGGEISWVKDRKGDGRHWMGGAIGHLQDDDENSNFISFDLDTYVAFNYKYYRNGIQGQGFHMNSGLRLFSEGMLPIVGFGYNF